MREALFKLAREYFREHHEGGHIVPGKDYIPVSGKVLDAEDLVLLLDSALDLWLTTGRFAAMFERDFARYMGQGTAVLVNSGSSANLLAVSALTSPELGDRRLRPGDEVITVAAGFPTTVNPIVQNGCTPVFVDITLGNYQLDVAMLEAARSDKTRAVIAAHTLGNAFDAQAVADFCREHDLWLIEDCCDAVGTTLHGNMVGTFGDLATVSFYPAHHLTMGEGGAVLTSSGRLKKLLISFRDWGRDCWCAPGKENTCGKRFAWQLGDLPKGYDHKYIYKHIGYNFKVTDMQAALGVSQLRKLDSFVSRRRRNFEFLLDKVRHLEAELILPVPTPGAVPSWFGFPLAVRNSDAGRRQAITVHLEEHRVGTRQLFGGNLSRQPLYQGVHTRAIGELPNSDFVMNNAFWLGIYPALDEPHLEYMAQRLEEAVR